VFAKRAAIAALERVATSDGDLAAGRRWLAGIDPLVRGRALRLMRAAQVDALATTRVRGALADAHGARLAYLALVGRPVPAEIVDDVEATRQAFDEARARAPRFRRWLWPLTSLVLVSLIAGGVATARFASRAAASAAASESARAQPSLPPAGAYAHGGIPRSSPAIRRAFSVDLPDFSIALDRLANAAAGEATKLRADIDAAEARTLASDVRATLGEAASERLRELLAAARQASTAGAARHDLEGDALLHATGALDDALAAKDIGYFVDGDVVVESDTGRRHVIVFAFEVEKVTVFKSTESVVALELRRIDHLNWSHALLGFTRPELRAALVLMDAIDRQLVSTILVGLAPDGKVTLFDPADRSVSPELVSKVEKRAAEIVREEYGDPEDAAASARLGQALGRRHALFTGWQRDLEARGITLMLPGRLHLEGDSLADLKRLVSAKDFASESQIEGDLRDREVLAAYALARSLLVASIARHEVQHRLDFDRAAALRMPPSLERWAGPALADGRERRAAARARSEMSAYLSQIARDERTTKSDATLALRFLLDDKLQGIPECYAALAILEGLADELAIPIDGPLVEGANVVRPRAASLYLAVMEKPKRALEEAAKRVWEKSFGAELPPLEKLPPP
jgi:hypothetical protein